MSHSYTIYVDRLSGLLRPRFVVGDPSLLCSAEKDFEYCSKRFKGEGIRFLTVTLPELRKAIDLSFQTGRLETPMSFRRFKDTSLPVFLHSHFVEIYEDDGTFRLFPNIVSSTM